MKNRPNSRCTWLKVIFLDVQFFQFFLWISAPTALFASETSPGWAFQPIRASSQIISELSPKENSISGDSLIDLILNASRLSAGVEPAKPAEPGILLRRVYLDLVGYPPSIEVLRSFAQNPTDDAYLRIVDQLLASPQFGERLGRRFLDIWRYADWYGLGAQLRNSQKHIWRWRDYVIDSLNEDKGYDLMLMEMLAADEMYPDDWEKAVATGFLARNYYLFNRDTWLDDTLEHTFKAFMGLTLNCAKCHDHKYDPISQDDYYRMRAFFEPHQVRLDPIPGELNYEKDGLPRVYDAHPDAPTFKYIRGDSKNPDKETPLSPALPEIFKTELDIQTINLPRSIYHPGLRDYVLDTQRKKSQSEIRSINLEIEKLRSEEPDNADMNAIQKIQQWELKLGALESRREQSAARYASWLARRNADAGRLNSDLPQEDQGSLARQAHLAEKRLAYWNAKTAWMESRVNLLNTDSSNDEAYKKALEKVSNLRNKSLEAEKDWLAAVENPKTEYTSLREGKKAPEGPDETAESQALPFPSKSTGRRLALAKWIASKDNPLTARVAVNHLWTRHFGRPLVQNVFDFGNNSPKPTHPDLLDALADEFMKSDWSLKELTRMIVTSQAYRLQSSNRNAPRQSLERDPENRFYWKMNPIRMESQVLRDSLLVLAGEIDWTMGGSPIEPKDQSDSRRRGLYFHHSRDDLNRFQVLFDEANILECYRREESIVPQQALGLVNSKESNRAAEGIHRLLLQELGSVDNEEWIRFSFSYLLGYPPTPEESAICEEQLLAFQNIAFSQGDSDPTTRSRTRLIHALLNHNDFITRR